MFKILVITLGLSVTTSVVEAKNPQHFLRGLVEVQVAEDSGRFEISPSDAANIARGAFPGSKVLNVKLLPSGVYAVTLRDGGSVMRVMVDATNGSIS